MDPSPASSSTASHSITSGHDVFINHRGPDTKNSFASYLYHALLSRGLNPFLDRKELEEGVEFPSQIVDVIKNASVHVAIFSPAYADSRWCLHELVLMQETRATILPVFYNVEPAELRWTDHNKSGRYAEALNQLQEKKTVDSQTNQEKPRYDPAIIQKWRNALSKVADTSGFDLKGKFNGDEGLMLDQVIERVLKIMATKRQLYVAKFPTGLNDKVKDFETTVLRQQPTGKAQVVGIVGWGGVGKTTMSKEVFNRKHSDYSRSHFLSDVRENAKISLHSLQSKLLKGLGQLDGHVNDIHQGTQRLLEFLSSAKVLLVLDDIDHQDQVDALLPDRDALHRDSLIVITTRDKDVLARLRVEEPSIYKLTGLTAQHSQELFCSYAFYHPHPLPGFVDLVNKFVNACGGLPLSLKVFGALLFRKEKYHWEDTLYRLHQVDELPSKIKHTLKISYDALNGEEKQIFLDIACFFIGKKKNIGIGLWNESRWKCGFQNLESKCLIEVDSRGCIHMHDHLRDLGRQIGEEELPRRLWRSPTENIDDWLQQQSSVITEARGISIAHMDSSGISIAHMDSSGISMDSSDESIINSSMLSRYQTKIKKLFGNHHLQVISSVQEPPRLSVRAMKLQVISSEGYLLERILKKVQSPNLTWLSWRDCPYSYLPSWIPTRNLSVLTVQGKVFNTLWQDKSQSKHFTNLYRVDLSGCTELRRLPDSLGDLTNLHHMDLSWCWKLERLPDSLGGLTNLHHMDLSHCRKLERLPDSLGGLTNLHHMDLSDCRKLERLPDSLGGLTNLHHMDLFLCSMLERLPDSLGVLTNLRLMDLSQCRKLERLPDSLGGLTNLHHMDLTDCEKLERLPDSLGGLTNLHHMDLSRCRKLERLPDSLGGLTNLHHMDLSQCWQLERLSESLGGLTNMDLSLCSNLERLPNSLGGLTNLHHMDLRGCEKLERLPDSLGGLTNLHHMDLSQCRELERLPDSLGGLTNLHHMDLSLCSMLERLPDSLGVLTNLRLMDLSQCRKLERLPDSLGGLTNLHHMDLRDCEKLERLPDSLGGLTNLHHMDLSRCRKLERLPDSLGGLTNLHHMDLRDCEKLERLSDSLGGLTNLHHMDLSRCRKLERLPDSLGGLTNLHHMDLSVCSKLERLPDSLGGLTDLHHMNLRWCRKLERLPDSLGGLTNLHHMDLSDCRKLERLPDSLGGLTNLHHMDLSGCSNLERLPDSLGGLTNLYHVDLSWCDKLERLPDSLRGLPNLHHMDLRQAEVLRRVRSYMVYNE